MFIFLNLFFCVSTKLNKYIVFTMQTYKKLIEVLFLQVIPVPNEKAEDLKGLFMEMGSEKNMEFDMLDDETDLKEVENFYSEADYC